jgi:dihydrodipicolinate reductase
MAQRRAFHRRGSDGSYSPITSITKPTAYWSGNLQVTTVDGAVSQADDLAQSDRENRVAYSETLSNAVWNKTGWPSTVSGATVTATAANDAHGIYQLITSAATVGTVYRSIYDIAYNNYQFAIIGNNQTATKAVVVDLLNGVLGTATGCTATIETIGTKRYRVILTYTAASTTIMAGMSFATAANNTTMAVIWNAAGTEKIDLYSASVQLGSVSAPWISPVYVATTAAPIYANSALENRVLYSENLASGASYWNYGSAVNLSATEFKENAAAAATHYVTQGSIPVVTGTTYRLKYRAKRGTGTRNTLVDLTWPTTGTSRLYVDLGTQAVVGTTGTSVAWITSTATADSEWTIIEGTVTAANTGNLTILVHITDASNTRAYNGDNTSSIHATAVEFKLASASPTYIPTTTTAILSSAFPATQGTAANRPILSGGDNRENRVLYSENLAAGASYWNYGSAVNISATEFKENAAAAATHYVTQGSIPVVTGTTYRLKYRAKRGTGTRNTLVDLTWPTTGTSRLYVDLGTQSVVGTTGTSVAWVSSTATADGVWTIIEGTATAANTGNLSLLVHITDASNTRAYDGDNASSIHATEIDFNVATSSSTYAPTTTYPIYPSINGNRVFVFNGTTHNLTTTLAVNPTGGMSGAVVVKPNLVSSGNFYIMAGYDTTTASRFVARLSINGTIVVGLFNGTSAYIQRASNNGAYSANEALVLSFIYDGGTSSSGIKVYKNGVQIDTTDSNGGSYTVPTAGAVLILGNGTGVTNWMNGSISEPIYVQGTYWSDAEHQAVVAKLMAQFGI